MPLGTTSLTGAATQLRDINATDTDTRHHKFDVFAVLRPIRSSIVQPDIRIHQFDTYNNPQQPSLRLRHTYIFRLISSKSVGLAVSSFLFISPCTDMINRTDCDCYATIRYDDTLRCN